jgi:hypothetical protein
LRHWTSSYLIPVWVPGEGANVELALRGDEMANAASLHIPHTQVTLKKTNASTFIAQAVQVQYKKEI